MTAEELSDDEIDRILEEQNAGILSLNDGTESYGIPQSFGYDGTHLYFQLVYDEDSHKMEFVETTEVASFAVHTEEPAISVVARGPLERVPPEVEVVATSAIAENASIPTLSVDPDRPPSELSFSFYRLCPDDVSGRAFTPTVTDSRGT